MDCLWVKAEAGNEAVVDAEVDNEAEVFCIQGRCEAVSFCNKTKSIFYFILCSLKMVQCYYVLSGEEMFKVIFFPSLKYIDANMLV